MGSEEMAVTDIFLTRHYEINDSESVYNRKSGWEEGCNLQKYSDCSGTRITTLL